MRKHVVIKIEAEGRDQGKSFLIVEKSAYDAERWATRALMALGRSGIDVPQEAMQAGALGLLLVGIEAFKRMPFEDAEPLLDEMLTCIAFVPDPDKIDPNSGRPLSRPLLRGDDFNDGDIADVATLLTLRTEVLQVHLGFSLAATLSNLAAAAQTLNRPATSTSPQPAAPSSDQAAPA